MAKLGKIEKWAMNRRQHSMSTIHRAMKLFQLIEMPETGEFIEVGCGSGAVSIYIAQKHSLNVTGTDIDGVQLQLARQKSAGITNIEFIEADATDLPFESTSFDIVLSFGVMHHISNWLVALKEINRILKPGGYFLYWDIFYAKWATSMTVLFRGKYGMTLLDDFTGYVEKTELSRIHSSLSSRLLFYQYEAVFKKGE